MKKKPQPYLNYVYLAIILIAVVLVVMLFFIKEETTLSTEDDGIKNTYVTNILKKRLTKDVDIIDNTASRFNLGERDKFAKKNLQYFYPDKDFRVLAEFVTDTSTPIFQMPTTTERKPNYRIYGYMRFNIGDTVCKLTVYQNVDFMNSPDYDSTLFIPFNDNTNGLYTYGGGRYMDIEIPITNFTQLDFNEAYNPYCAYSSRWSCPLVPFENDLNVSIFAGEKRYK